MKTDIHPEFRMVVFKDISCDFEMLCGTSTDPKNFNGTATVDGVEYPVIRVDISSGSHPFYTGTQKLMDTEGRVDRFMRKYGMKKAEPKAEADA
jgi:large subunit ribosomal protein L31